MCAKIMYSYTEQLHTQCPNLTEWEQITHSHDVASRLLITVNLITEYYGSEEKRITRLKNRKLLKDGYK